MSSSVILGVVKTEKSHAMNANSVYSFIVAKKATKAVIANAIEFTFNTKIKNIRTVKIVSKNRVFRGSHGNTSEYKKAYVTLLAGMKIDLDSLKSNANV